MATPAEGGPLLVQVQNGRAHIHRVDAALPAALHDVADVHRSSRRVHLNNARSASWLVHSRRHASLHLD